MAASQYQFCDFSSLVALAMAATNRLSPAVCLCCMDSSLDFVKCCRCADEVCLACLGADGWCMICRFVGCLFPKDEEPADTIEVVVFNALSGQERIRRAHPEAGLTVASR